MLSGSAICIWECKACGVLGVRRPSVVRGLERSVPFDPRLKLNDVGVSTGEEAREELSTLPKNMRRGETPRLLLCKVEVEAWCRCVATGIAGVAL